MSLLMWKIRVQPLSYRFSSTHFHRAFHQTWTLKAIESSLTKIYLPLKQSHILQAPSWTLYQWIDVLQL